MLAAFVLLILATTPTFAQAPCALSTVDSSVTICSPANGATVASPVRIVAGTTSSRLVNLIQIYVDGVKVYQVKAKTLDTQVPMAIGTRRVAVQAKDTAAKWFKQVIYIKVVSAQPSVAVSISPTSASLQTGTTKQFTAAVAGTTNTAVNWSATGGTISPSGLYTAPNTAGTFTVRATSVADASKSASATVTVTAPAPAIAVSITPTSASLQTSGTKQFTATVTGSTNTAVTWSATGGTVSTAGLYTAPNTAGTYTVKATSVADASKSASATVTVTAPAPAIGVSINPTSATLQTSATQQFAATVTGTSNTAVTWSATGGTISTSGLYTAPSAAGTFSVRATSVADASKSASATVTVNPAPGAITVSPTSLSFGSVLTGNTATRTVNVSNTGSSDATVFSASTTGAGFSVTAPTFPFTLAPGASRAVSIQFAPQSSGPATGTASFVSNAPNSPTAMSLSGTGTVPVAHSVDLYWNASTSVVSGYNVYRSTQTGGPYSRVNGTLQIAANYTDSSVQSGLRYFYVVRAVDSQGRESANSNEVTAAIPTP
ncbi:MAG: choice-of-anchor D domain-containing protein [Acidobacteriales bacterium]|nr:choice-of-anchor D domain-containing protein [Terriglobales bacterium]